MFAVLDSSVASSWALGDEAQSDRAAETMSRVLREDIIVPAIFWYELRNVLVRSERRGRIDPVETETFLQYLSSYSLTLDLEHDEARVLYLARTHRLTVYDAAYLETALRFGADLATLDDALAEAALREGVPNPAG